MDGIFGGLFDIDDNGNLDTSERTMEYAAISELEEEYKDEYSDDDEYEDDDDEDEYED
jgi:hypothetical protein